CITFPVYLGSEREASSCHGAQKCFAAGMLRREEFRCRCGCAPYCRAAGARKLLPRFEQTPGHLLLERGSQYCRLEAVTRSFARRRAPGLRGQELMQHEALG